MIVSGVILYIIGLLVHTDALAGVGACVIVLGILQSGKEVITSEDTVEN